jgi:uncharacterized membrane protein
MGGQKTMGAIHGEAFNFLKKNYVAMLVITLIIYFIGIILNTVTQAIAAPVGGIMSMFSSLFAYRLDSVREVQDIIPVILPMLGIIGIGVAISFAIGLVGRIVQGAFEIGAKNATMQLLSGTKPTFEGVWQNFSKNWKRYIGITAWSMLWVLLWSLLLIVPGYIKSLSYRFAPYLMIQYPDMKIKNALKKSMEITQGYKGRLFGLDLILLGYGVAMMLLCCLVLPLLASIFWLPLLTYAMYTIAYLDISRAAVEKGLLAP